MTPAGATGKVTYSTMFVIGDVTTASNGMTEDVGMIGLDKFTKPMSSNTTLLPRDSIVLTQMPVPPQYVTQATPREYLLQATTAQGISDYSTVTIEFHDPEGNYTSTSFVLQAIDNTNSAPTIGPANAQNPGMTYLPGLDPGTATFTYLVTPGGNDGSTVSDLRVAATSSNSLVPNDFVSYLKVTQPGLGGTGTVEVTPATPLPPPSPGLPQSSTITLNVSDDKYSRQFTFLYLAAAAQNGVESTYSRPTGVYLQDPIPISGQRGSDAFLTGEMHRISWNTIEGSLGTYTWGTLDQLFPLPFGQDISLNLIEEPCYLINSMTPATRTWCDTKPPQGNASCTTTCMSGGANGNLRAVPWDKNLWSRRENYIINMASHLPPINLAKVSIINTNLPGGDSGIRNADGHAFSATKGPPLPYTMMDGYSRPALLGAIQHELHTVQDVFLRPPYSAPILVQIGFFLATDDKGPTGSGGDGTYTDQLWQWLYEEAGDASKGPNKDANGNPVVALADEFNGVIRPRVAFFQESLAAARSPGASALPNYAAPSSTPAAYTFTPDASQLPTFAYWAGSGGDPHDLRLYNNAIDYQANTPWSSPFDSSYGDKLNHTLNGTPNDGMEAAFNAYLNEYLEVYPPDIDEAQPQTGSATLDAALWQSELQSWHDYYKDQRALSPRAMEAPAGLSATYQINQGNTQFVVTWYAMYGATAYTLQSKPLGTTPAQDWSTVSGCAPASTSCTVTVPAGSTQYSFRVQGSNTSQTSGWANAAIFLSESLNDGYVISNYSIGQLSGIRAGEGSGMPLPHWRGILSFNTGALSSLTTSVVGARLRLHQTSAGGNFNPTTNPCLVDVGQGSFGNNAGLAGTDYDAAAPYTRTAAFNIFNVAPPVTPSGWFDMVFPKSLASSYVAIGASAPNDHTQFRIRFQSSLGANLNESWDSGESATSPPQLIVQYQ